jgi:predicted GNAT family N-acyltransferase
VTGSEADDGVRLERVPVEVIRPLRAAVLRAGRPWSESVYPKDELATTVHLAALSAADVVVGCSTWFADPWTSPEAPAGELAWRLRGMATAPGVRGTGVGGRLLAAGLSVAREAGAGYVWCQARAAVQGFYERQGFRAVGGIFLAAHGVEHVEMWTPL